MKRVSTLIVIVLLMFGSTIVAQTPGQIFQAATPAINPLNPNGDGFATSTGVAFTPGGNEASQFELPWVALPQVSAEPVSDIDTGANCGTSDIVSDPNIGSGSSYLFISDPDNIPNNGDERMFFRMRIGKAGSGAFGYSFLFDTDLKFGFTGPNADPNAVAGNPGFELEVILGSGGGNSAILIENVDGTTNGTTTSTISRSTNAQRSYALYTDPGCSGNNDPFFLDFFVPLSSLGFTTTSNFRVASATSSSPNSALGGSASDIAGVNDDNFPVDDNAFIAQINANPVSDVSITKTLDTAGPYVAGQTLNYTVNVNNAGPNIANNVVVTDTPTNLTITSVSGGGCTGFPCTIASIASGNNVSITLVATINTPGGFDNTASVTAREADNNTANNTDNTGNGGSAAAPTFIQITDGAWDAPGNWSDNLVPTVNDDAIIDANVQSTVTQDQAVKSLILRQGTTELTSVEIADSFTVNVKESLENNGEFIGEGEVLLDGPNPQVMSGSGDYENLRINNANGVLVDNTVLSDPTEINGVLYPDSGTFTTSGNVLFPCTFVELGAPGSGDFANGKAGQIGPIGIGGSISGDVKVEQCYPGRRAYRYVSASTTTTTSIQDNWQENATAYNNIPVSSTTQDDGIPYGFGTHITGLGYLPGHSSTGPGAVDQTDGLDWQPSGNPSMFEFDESTQSFNPVLATEPTPLVAGKAYSMIIRGSREVDLTSNASPTYNTKLRSTGTVEQGSVTINTTVNAVPTPTARQYVFVGNPFHAIVDMIDVFNNSTGLNQFVYAFNPTLGSNNSDTNDTSVLEGNRGAFVTIDLTSPPTSGMSNFLQVYQGVFMDAAVLSPSIVFSESDKAVREQQLDVFSTPTDRVTITLYDQDSYADNSTENDMTVINFDQNKSSSINFNDALKFTNPNENLGRLEGNSLLSIENRAMPEIGEVLELFTNNYRTTDYVFVVKVDGLLDNTVTLYDNYTGTETVLNNDASTAVSFTVDPANPVSEATDRFELRFETSTLGNNEFDLQGISVYPNPASDILNINLGDNTGRFESLELYDISGRLIAKKDLSNQVLDVQMNVDSYSPGVYVLKVSSGAEQFSSKVIIR